MLITLLSCLLVLHLCRFKVTPNLALIQRLGYNSQNCKMVYFQLINVHVCTNCSYVVVFCFVRCECFGHASSFDYIQGNATHVGRCVCSCHSSTNTEGETVSLNCFGLHNNLNKLLLRYRKKLKTILPCCELSVKI